MVPPRKRKSAVKKGKVTAMIDTTPLEIIDEDGDLILRLVSIPVEEQDEDEDMSGVSIKGEDGGGSSGEAGEKWKGSGYVDLRVSSKHLTVVSPVLKRLMVDSSEYLELPDDDLEAFKILLNIIHGRVRQVPLKVNLDMVRNIAMLVEKYQMVEVVELYVKIWVKELPQPSADDFESDLLRWICVCWIFKLPVEFKSITRRAVWDTSSRIEVPVDENYTFPHRILDRIESQRKNVIYSMVFIIQRITDRCTHEGGVCPERAERGIHNINPPSHRKACDAMILGSLLMTAYNGGLWPIPKDPYHGLTVQKVIDAARGLKIQSLCDTLSKVPVAMPVDEAHGAHGAHGYNKSVKKAIEKREAEAEGLCLEEFL